MNVQQVVARISDGGPVSRAGGGYMVSCPVHGAGGGDSRPSLEISEGATQPILLNCHAGCAVEDILAAVNLTWADISAEIEEQVATRVTSPAVWLPGGKTHMETYEYIDAEGNLVWEVLRSTDKDFFQRRPDASKKSGWDWRAPALSERVLYRLPKVLEAIENGEEVWLPEGERDVHALEKVGVVATTNSGGAKAWHPQYAESLRGARVTIVADRDEPGRAHARAVRSTLVEVEATCRIVEAAQGKDARDHLEAGLTLEQFVETVPYEQEAKLVIAPNMREYLEDAPGERQWIVPGLLSASEVILLTGYEGDGKSTFVKQFCTQVASGIHPFTLNPIPQVRTLFIDLENPKMDNYEDFALMRARARHHTSNDIGDYMRIIDGVKSIDLASDAGVAWLVERVHAHKPQIMTIGPLYKMVKADTSSEDSIRPVLDLLDYIRDEYGTCILMEHHVPHRNGDVRDVRPIGSSVLMRWPAFGYGLAPITEALKPGEHKPKKTGVYEWASWRGARRRDRQWPSHLRWGRPDTVEWPWMEADPQDIADAMEKAKKR